MPRGIKTKNLKEISEMKVFRPDENGINQGGRPAYEPNAEDETKFRALVGCRLHQALIGMYMKVTYETLIKYYPHVLDEPKIDLNASVSGGLYKKAIVDGDTAALIFLAKTQLKWRGIRDAIPEEEVRDQQEQFTQLASILKNKTIEHNPDNVPANVTDEEQT